MIMGNSDPITGTCLSGCAFECVLVMSRQYGRAFSAPICYCLSGHSDLDQPKISEYYAKRDRWRRQLTFFRGWTSRDMFLL